MLKYIILPSLIAIELYKTHNVLQKQNKTKQNKTKQKKQLWKAYRVRGLNFNRDTITKAFSRQR